MKKLAVLILIVLGVYGLYYAWSKGIGPFKGRGNVSVSGDEVTVNMPDLEGRFLVTGDLSDNFMLFGGSYMARKNTVSPVFLAGLSIEDAKEIYASYPDFFKCKSPGAPLAQSLIHNLDVIPFDSAVLRILVNTINEFKQNLRKGGQRVCVDLEGEELEMESVIIKQTEEDVGNLYGQHHFFLIRFAERVDCESLLENDN